MKYKWKVAEPPTGRYRSFYTRGWPTAYYLNKEQSPAAIILCEDEYIPRNVKTGKHKELTLIVNDYTNPDPKNPNCEWVRKRAKQKFKTLKEAKEWFAKFIKKNPQICPKEDKK